MRLLTDLLSSASRRMFPSTSTTSKSLGTILRNWTSSSAVCCWRLFPTGPNLLSSVTSRSLYSLGCTSTGATVYEPETPKSLAQILIYVCPTIETLILAGGLSLPIAPS